MNKRDLVLAALSTAGNHQYTPVQVQKLLFLTEKNVSASIGGPFFSFEAYDYGPFDSSLYEVLRSLEANGLVTSETTFRGWKKHALTDEGAAIGQQIFSGLPAPVADYIRRASDFVRRLSFTELVSAIYKAYPEMKEKSVFRDE